MKEVKKFYARISLQETVMLERFEFNHKSFRGKNQTAMRAASKCVFFLCSWGGVRLSPLGASATAGPVVPAPDDR
jgi:hypothetical protein